MLARLAQRFGVELSPYPALVFDEVSAIAYGGLPFGEVGEQAALLPRVPGGPVPVPGTETRPQETGGAGLRLVTYRPLFSGPAVERVPELQFQRPGPEVELSRDDAQRLGISNGQTVTVRSNGTSRELRARLNRELSAGIVRIPDEHAGDLEGRVEISA